MTPIVFIFTVLAFLINRGKCDSWYKGCYNDISGELGQSGKIVESPDSLLVGCAKLCSNQGFLFAGIQKGDNCTCLNNTQSLVPVDDSLCSHRCPSTNSALSLYCGGDDGQWSLYHSLGPYLLFVKGEVKALRVVVNTNVSLDAFIEIGRFVNFTKGTDEEWLKSYHLVWRVDGKQFSANVREYGNKISSRSLFTIPEPGIFHVEVIANNAISSAYDKFNITVLLPKPQDLQIVPLKNSDHFPSCLPEKYSHLSDSAIVATFVNQTIIFEVSVAVGTNLAFVLEHRKNGSGIIQRFLMPPDCDKFQCIGTEKDYKFNETGVYIVTATVENQHGHLQKNITVVVMERRLNGITFDIEDDQYVQETSEPIQFLVTVETTSRQQTELEVNFGDGEMKRVSLKEHANTTQSMSSSLHEDTSSLRDFVLTASYGEGCNLSIKFHYIYTLEGRFMPKIYIMSKIGFLTLSLREVLVVHRLFGPKLVINGPIRTNQSAEFLLHFQKSSLNLSVVWTIIDKDKNVIDNITTTKAQLNYTFSEPGRYSVAVAAVNRISSVVTETQLDVHTPIEGLSISCTPADFVAIAEQITCMAQVDEGSDVTFEWNFKDRSKSRKMAGNLSVIVSHEYFQEGAYEVSVMASNEVGPVVAKLNRPIIVEKIVESVMLLYPKSMEDLVNSNSCFVVRPDCSCHVQFQFDFGSGLEDSDSDERCLQFVDQEMWPNPYLHTVSHSFPSPGIFPVTIHAFNNVSNAKITFNITAQNRVGILDVKVQGHAIQGMPTVIVAKQEGSVLSRNDLIYKWSLPDGNDVVTLLPVVQTAFQHPGVQLVNLTVRNLVDSVSKQLEVKVHKRAPGHMGLQHAVTVQTYKEVEFTLVGDQAVSVLTVNYSYGEVERYFNQSSWKHAFSLPGVHEVIVTINGNGQIYQLQTYIAAQEPIRSLEIVGPSAVQIEKPGRSYTWLAVTNEGSHLLYTWLINNVPKLKTTERSFTLDAFKQAGIETLQVKAENSISSVQTTLNLTVQYPIEHVELHIPDVLLGDTTNITITIKGGRSFLVSCDFGDGTYFNTSSREHDKSISVIQPADEQTRTPPIYRFILAHVYKNVGEYTVVVTSSNLFSRISESSRAIVGEPISGVVVSTDSSPAVPVNVPIAVSATVASGEDLTFDWQLRDVNSKLMELYLVPQIQSEGKASNFTFSVGLPGKYQVFVLVSNRFYWTPIQSKLSYMIHIIENITYVKFLPQAEGVAVGKETSFRVVTDGSDVVFHFDFGDGGTQARVGVLNLMNMVEGVGKHTYTEVGVYNVMVTASNPLVNVSATLKRPFHVQIPPTLVSGKLLEKKTYCTLFGNVTTLHAGMVQGTNVSFKWKMDDETEFVDEGGVVNHQYRSAGKRIVQVIAYNKAGQLESFAEMDVVYEIQSVNLTAEKMYMATKKKVEFWAVPEPNYPGLVDYYEWKFSGHVGYIQTKKPSIFHQFSSSGEKIVTVSAANCLGRTAVSKPLEVIAVSPLSPLSIDVKGESLVNRPIIFTSHFFEGDHLTITWDFGDDTPVIKGDQLLVNHTYTSVGEYLVNLTAENFISSDSITIRLFILDKICKPPEIFILGSQKREFHFYQSEQVHIESNVVFNCSLEAPVAYTWSFVNRTGDKVKPRDKMLHRQSLILSPHALDPGQYTVQLKVQMMNESSREPIVYSMWDASLAILNTPLKSIIAGGTLHTIGHQETSIYLDGSSSHDPDNPNNPNIRYNWTCQLLPSHHSCYNETAIRNYTTASKFVFDKAAQQLTLTSPEVTLPVAFLIHTDEDYKFRLEVSSDNRIASTDQVIKIKASDQTMRIKISCHQCRSSWVNANEKVSLQTECFDCPDSVMYQWRVFIVYDSEITDPEPFLPSYCHPSDPDGVLYMRMQNKSVSMATTPTTTETSSTSSTTTFATPVQSFNGRPWHGDPIEGPVDSSLPMAGIEEGRFHLEAEEQQSGKRKIPPAPDPTVGGEMPRIGEGDGGRRNTGREDHFQHIQVVQKAREVHVSNKQRYSVPLSADQTFTGLDKQSLVIKPGLLLQNHGYIVWVSARSKGRETAEAEMYFRVNRSPIKGSCSVMPLSGVEMETNFTAFCREWRDQHKPLTYEVTFRMNENSPKFLIYRGASHEINFQLPSGKAENNYTVLLSVSIQDNFGASTSYCRLPVTVRPKKTLFINDSKGSNGCSQGRCSFNTLRLCSEECALERASHYGDDRTLYMLIVIMATRVNQLPAVTNATLLVRQTTRYAFLRFLNALPMRNEVEVMQAAQSLVAATAMAEELNNDTLELAVGLLESIQKRTESLFTNTVDPNENMLTLVIKAVSSIVRANIDRTVNDVPDNVTTRAIAVLDKLLKVELRHHSVGEAPIQISADFVSVLGSHYFLKTTNEIQINAAQFKVPSNMVAMTKMARKNQKSSVTMDSCYLAHMTTFKGNPFANLPNQIWTVETEVMVLNLYSCEGLNIAVANLSSDNEVHIQIPRHQEVDPAYSYHTLEKTNMNIHQFNLTSQNINQPLLISIQLEPVSDRTFPISVLISQLFKPSPQRYTLKRDFPADRDHLRIFLPSGSFKNSSMYYLGIVDSRYNAGRHREGQVLARNYTFSLWLGNCLFWDQIKKQWSSWGCQVTEESTAESLQCKCNHLTAFGGHFELIPNDFSLTDVEGFFSLHQNPVTIILVSLTFCIYFILFALCRQADLHDEKKGRVVYLSDNGGADKQMYEVTVETGFRLGAGSTAKVSLIIHGEDGMSETRELISDDCRPLFERNSRDKFVVTHPDSLGKLRKVQLWHNNSGPSPSWYLSRVLIKDLIAGNVYYFLCDKWFAVEKDDGKVEREILALHGNIGFSKVFWAKGSQYMADFHLWSSLLTCPSYSRFTRTQRLTCCVTLVMAYMCLNAMWYKQEAAEVRGEFGLLDVSWQNVAVGGIICAIIIPLNLILEFLFRRSRVHYPGTEPEKEYETGKPSKEQSIDTQEEQVQPITTYSLFDQSILNWQSIQEWAQKQWLKREQNIRSGSNSVKTNNQSQSPQSASPPSAPVLQTLRKEEETDVASSGFEDSASQAYSQSAAERNRVQPTPTEMTPLPSPSSQGREINHNDYCPRRTSRRFFLPFWCRYMAWTLCALIIVFCGGVTVLYGFRFGKIKSILWLQSLYFSFMICVFIAQPLLILLTVIYTALRHREDPCILDHYDDGFYGNTSESARRRRLGDQDACEDYEELERGVAARQRSRYLRFARPPQEKALSDSRKKTLKERKTVRFFSHTMVFSLMLILLIIIGYGKDTMVPFYCNQAVKNAFLNSSEMGFTDIKTRGDWFRWSKTTLLDGLYGIEPQDGHVPLHETMVIGHLNSYLIGQVHIRQLRVPEEECSSFKYIPLFESCRYHYGRHSNLKTGENTSWTSPSLYDFPLWGRHALYDVSGSTVQLSRNKTEARLQLEELESSSWIDLQTRAIIVEMTMVNIPTNLFTSVSLLLELPPTGGSDFFPIIMSTQIFRYITFWDNCILACEMLFLVVMLTKTRQELCKLVKKGRKYYRDLWNYIESAFGLVSLFYVMCYVFRFVLVADIVERLRNTFYEEFINISFLALWDEILRSLIGVLVFLAIVKFVPLLKYLRGCSKLAIIYRRARKEIIMFMALFVVLLCAFTGLGVAMFGSVSYGLKNTWSGLLSMTALMTGIYHQSQIDTPGTPWWQLFILSYMSFGVGLLTCYMVAVLTRRLRVYKEGEVTSMGLMDGIKYLTEKFLFWSGIKRVEPMEEPENVLPPEFTMAEIEYQVDELLFRMNNLTGSSNLPEKPQGYLTDSTEASNGAGDDGISSGGSEERVGMDTDRLDHRVQRIEDKLYANEPYLAQLIKLDSIGADVLSQEKEKQLRSHLELEVFRQLQLQRQEGGATVQLPGNANSALTTALYGSSAEQSSSSGSPGSQKMLQLELPKIPDFSSKTFKGRPVAPSIFPEKYWSELRNNDVPVSPSDVQPKAGSSSPESPHYTKSSPDVKPKVKPPVPPKPSQRLLCSEKPAKPSSSSENASPQSSESEKRHRRTDSSSGHSGSMERSESVKKCKPELPPKPKFIQSALKEQTQDSNKSPTTGQKIKPFKLPPDRVLQRGDLGGNIAAESSSGSEQDGTLIGRRPSGKRNLRKTKSRGKGKGSGGLSPALMLEDLALENPDHPEMDQTDVIEEVVMNEQEL